MLARSTFDKDNELKKANKILEIVKMLARPLPDKPDELKKANKIPDITEMFALTGAAPPMTSNIGPEKKKLYCIRG